MVDKSDEKDTTQATKAPDALPPGFPSVKPHVSEQAYRYTLMLKNGNFYEVTSDAKGPRQLLERMFCAEDAVGAVPRLRLKGPDAEFTFFQFPESVVRVTAETLESIVSDWTVDEVIDPDGDEDEEDEDEEDERPKRGKGPRKPWK